MKGHNIILKTTLLVSFLVLIGAASVSAQAIQSVYTEINQKKCKMIAVDPGPGESSTQRCPGVAGYKLLVLEGDLRQSITVIRPDGSKHELNLWSNVGGGGFSHLGPRAEWRVKNQKGKLVPIALIVRYEVSENAENANKTTSYLTVTKITSGQICLIESISPRSNQNAEARALADNSASKPCLAAP